MLPGLSRQRMGATRSNVGYRTKSRVNGWSCPPNPLQFVAWFAFLFIGIIVFTTVIPGIQTIWQPAVYIISGLLFLAHFVSHLITMTCNPADPAVIERMKDQRPMPVFDRSQHKHVIEEQFCYLCEVSVAAKSKHCSACNKCVSTFDHHCKWLNNCVGDRNYKMFMITMVTAFIGCIVLCGLTIMQFTAYFTDRQNGHILQQYREYLDKLNGPSTTASSVVNNSSYVSTTVSSITTAANTTAGSSTAHVLSSLSSSSTSPPSVSPDFRVCYVAGPPEVWLSFIMLTAVLTLVGMLLLGHLVGFHIYLICKGMTTYDYIVAQRTKAEQEARDTDVDVENSEKTAKKSIKANRSRVAPDCSQSEEVEMEEKKTNVAVVGGTFRGVQLAKEEADREAEEMCAPQPLSARMPPRPKRNSNHREKNGLRKSHSKQEERTHANGRGPHILPTEGLTVSPRSDISTKPIHLDVSVTQNSANFETKTLDSRQRSVGSVNLRPAAVPTEDYHSDSAESLQEIPVSRTRAGSLYQCSPRQSDYVTTDSSLTQSLDRRRRKKTKSSRDQDDLLNTTMTFQINSTAKFNPDGSLDYTDGFRTLPLTPLSRRRHNEVPPLDLSSLNEDSDGATTADRAKKSTSKRRRKKQSKMENKF